MLPAHTIHSPLCTSGNTNILKPEFKDIIRVQFTIKVSLNIRLLADLVFSIINNSAPCRQARQFTLMCYTPTNHSGRFSYCYIVSTLRQCTCCFKSRWTRTNNKNVFAFTFHVHLLWVPAFAPLLHESRILRASTYRHSHVARNANITTNAFADVLNPSFFDFLG